MEALSSNRRRASEAETRRSLAKLCLRPLSIALLVSLSNIVSAQPNTRSTGLSNTAGSIRGTVVMPDGSPVKGAVKVTLRVMRGWTNMMYTDEQGRFEIPNVSAGQYTIEVEPDRDRGLDISSENVTVGRGGPTMLTIYLKRKREDTQGKSEKTVSVAMLDQKVPSSAKREFDRATRFAREKRTDESIDALRRAIAIYPDYLMAHNDLGAQLLEREQFEEAIVELRLCLKIDPNAFNPALNLGIALLQLNRNQEALTSLERSLSIEPSSPPAHLYTGIALARLGNSDRSEKELKSAYDLGGSPYAISLFHLGQLYMKNGARELALQSFQLYLRECPNAPNAAQVESLIARLH
ncbi:MAG TPA: tetratricopeptide repeat protein [Pyrinomonadaceae bacterium]